jgi:hypothetical protein
MDSKYCSQNWKRLEKKHYRFNLSISFYSIDMCGQGKVCSKQVWRASREGDIPCILWKLLKFTSLFRDFMSPEYTIAFTNMWSCSASCENEFYEFVSETKYLCPLLVRFLPVVFGVKKSPHGVSEPEIWLSGKTCSCSDSTLLHRYVSQKFRGKDAGLVCGCHHGRSPNLALHISTQFLIDSHVTHVLHLTFPFSFLFWDNNWWNSLAKPITNDSKNKGKYNMVQHFARRTSHRTSKTQSSPSSSSSPTKYMNRIQKQCIFQQSSPSYHRRRHRHTGLWTLNKCPPRGVRAKNLFQTIGEAGDEKEQAVPPNEDPWAVDPNHQ